MIYPFLMYQKHINRQELEQEMLNYTSDDDSVEDFESVSKKK